MSVAVRAPRVCLARPVARRCVAAKGYAGNWLPGAKPPAWLDGSLPGTYGFDPLKLSENAVDRMAEGELINGRWAMLGVVGMLVVELLGFGNWFDAPLWAVNGGTATYFGVPVPFDIKTISVIEFVLIGGTELARLEETDPVKRRYPGGSFDPMGFAKDESKVASMKVKEVKNGRLAMMAFLGMICQHNATGKGPLENLGDHLSNPGANNFATNGVSLPGFAFPFLEKNANYLMDFS